MAVLKVLNSNNLYFDTESNYVLDIDRDYIEAFLFCSPEALYILSERLGHPITRTCWSFSTYTKEWSPYPSDASKTGEVNISLGHYEEVIISIITEGPLWKSKPDASLLAELEVKAYEQEIQLNKEREQKARELVHGLLNSDTNVNILSFKKYKEDVHEAELTLKIGEYKVVIEPVNCLGYADFKVTIKENYVS